MGEAVVQCLRDGLGLITETTALGSACLASLQSGEMRIWMPCQPDGVSTECLQTRAGMTLRA